MCPSLPVDGVNSGDYEAHVLKYHVNNSGSGDDTKPWNPYLAAQNLPAVLNDPSRGKQSNFFTKKWGDTFVEKTPINASPYLEKIDWPDFEVYLRRIGRRYKRHQRMEQSLLEREQSTSSFSSPSNRSSDRQTNNNHNSQPGYSESDLQDIPGK